MKQIVIDAYGADAGFTPVVQGIAKALAQGLSFMPVLVGPSDQLSHLMQEAGLTQEQYLLLDAQDAIGNQEPPTCVFSGREESSLVKAYRYLKEQDRCCGMISPGSTGALLVGSICHLGLIPGLKFPALGSALPCGPEHLVCLVDCGANVECTVKDLVRFAKIGDAFARCFCGIDSPRVGLMNVGREPGKGTALHREAFEALQQLDLNFVGNLEGSDLVSGQADVIVSDGYGGNIALKSTEAAGRLAMELVAQAGSDCDPQLIERLQQAIFKKLDFNSQGASTFLGPKKPVVKMHGCANENTTVAAISHVLSLDASNFVDTLAQSLQS